MPSRDHGAHGADDTAAKGHGFEGESALLGEVGARKISSAKLLLHLGCGHRSEKVGQKRVIAHVHTATHQQSSAGPFACNRRRPPPARGSLRRPTAPPSAAASWDQASAPTTDSGRQGRRSAPADHSQRPAALQASG